MKYKEYSISKTKETILNKNSIPQYRICEKDFTRSRKMDFEKVVMYGLNKKGLTSKMEIEEFNEIIDSKDISSPGVLKQRKKLRAEIYKDMMQNNLKAFYNEFTDEVKLFNYETYNKEELTNSQVKMIDNYIKDLKNPEINITKFMIKDDFYKTNENNTSGIYMKGNECYIRYNGIEFSEPFDHNTEKISVVICDGYNVELLYDTVKPTIIDYDNPVYNYRFFRLL